MPKQPRWTATQAERELINAGFVLLRTKGSHHIYGKGVVVVPFHTGQVRHPKFVRQIVIAVQGD